MALIEFIKEHPEINITINASSLMEFGQKLANDAIQGFIDRKEEKVYTRNEVLELFGVTGATLWRWAKTGIIEPKKIGNRVFYPESEIKRLSSAKS